MIRCCTAWRIVARHAIGTLYLIKLTPVSLQGFLSRCPNFPCYKSVQHLVEPDCVPCSSDMALIAGDMKFGDFKDHDRFVPWNVREFFSSSWYFSAIFSPLTSTSGFVFFNFHRNYAIGYLLAKFSARKQFLVYNDSTPSMRAERQSLVFIFVSTPQTSKFSLKRCTYNGYRTKIQWNSCLCG